MFYRALVLLHLKLILIQMFCKGSSFGDLFNFIFLKLFLFKGKRIIRRKKIWYKNWTDLDVFSCSKVQRP